ncbi:MAG TPA: helix-turn-helix domain-containing protein [Candidatus Acidoferrales bacterium]|nr:helix-turn-helix domain-containing protein [Candidatus Acidoferrales bacterium]
MSYQPATASAAAATEVVMKALDRLPTPDRLLALRSLAVLLGTRRAATVVAARSDGFSWAEIADRLGMSRQSVWERYGTEEGEVPPPLRGRRPRARSTTATFSNCAAYKAVTSRPDAIAAPARPQSSA